MSTADILKRNIPEFQQGAPELDSYLEAAGEFLDGTKEAIVNLDNVYDYKNSTPFFYEAALKDRGYEMPSRIDEATKRRVLRDLSELHLKNGTLDGVIHAVRMAGLTPEIRVGWLPSPRAIRKGKIIDPVSLIETRYDITRYVYTDMLYGEAVATDDGVFFEGYRYEDSLNENKIGPLAILGERYTKPPMNPVPVAKTPYIIVKFDESNKTLVTDPVIDPETGEVFEYSLSEEFQLINDTLKYFLVQNNRPTTMRVIIIVSLQPFYEEMTVNDEFEQTVVYNDDGGDTHVETFGADDASTYVGEIDISDIEIGSTLLIGTPTPYTSRFFIINSPAVGEAVGAANDVDFSPELSGTTYHTVGGTEFRIPMRASCEFIVTIPENVGVKVYGYRGTEYVNKELIFDRIVSATLSLDFLNEEYQEDDGIVGDVSYTFSTSLLPPGDVVYETNDPIPVSYEYDVLVFEYDSELEVDIQIDFLYEEFSRT